MAMQRTVWKFFGRFWGTVTPCLKGMAWAFGGCNVEACDPRAGVRPECRVLAPTQTGPKGQDWPIGFQRLLLGFLFVGRAENTR